MDMWSPEAAEERHEYQRQAEARQRAAAKAAQAEAERRFAEEQARLNRARDL
jgi:hypothetical protein